MLAAAFYERFITLDTWDLYEDSRPCLERLRRAGVTLVLVSNWESWLEPLLHHRRIHHYFDVLAISGQVGAEKPDAAIFHTALEQSGVTAEEAVHIGDSITSDVEGAQAVGYPAGAAGSCRRAYTAARCAGFTHTQRAAGSVGVGIKRGWVRAGEGSPLAPTLTLPRCDGGGNTPSSCGAGGRAERCVGISTAHE